MSKHELLQYISGSGWVTPDVIAGEYYLSVTGVFSRLEALRVTGFVKRERFKTQDGILRYHYSLTSKGVKKLDYFDASGCSNSECFCARRG